MDWFQISLVIVIAVVGFAAIMASVLLVAFLMHKEETCAVFEQDEAGEKIPTD